MQPLVNTKSVERSLPLSESVTAEPYLASPIVLLAAAVLLYISLTGTVPLTYDEAANFSFFSSKPPTYALWNYQSSNNPALIVCVELNNAGSWRRRVLRMGARSTIFVAGVVMLYLPVLDGVHKSSQLAEHLKTQPGTLLTDLTRFASFITLPIAIREIWLLPLGLVLIYSGIAWRGKSIERGKAHRLVYFAAFAGLFSILIPLILHAAGLSALPFARNLIAVPFFFGLGIFVAAENGLLFRSRWFRSGVRVAFVANLALTAGVLFTCFVVRSPLGYNRHGLVKRGA